jgi:hypothetical protein
MLSGYNNTTTGGTVFLDDVCGGNWNFDRQTVWIRQLNPEAKGKAESDINIRSDGSTIWMLGVKTEGPKTVVKATRGRIELWGGFFYASRGTNEGAAAIDLVDCEFLGSWVNHLGGSYRPQVRAKRGDRTDEFHLNVDFGDRSLLPLIQKELRGKEIILEKSTNQQLRTPDSVFRHGSYGVKIPLFTFPAKD